MKRLLLVVSWFVTTSITLFATLSFYQALNDVRGLHELVAHNVNSFASSDNAIMAYAALPGSVSQIQGAILGADARPVTIDAYLETYNSPMFGLGEFIVETADFYKLDPYLIVAVAQQESNLCKIAPTNSFNCWGWGVHAQGTLRFPSFYDSITTVTLGLREDYFDKGYDTPEKIMAKYTPLSNGSWAAGVNQFLDELNSGNF